MKITAVTLRKFKLAVLGVLALLIIFSNRAYLGKLVGDRLRFGGTASPVLMRPPAGDK